MQQEYFDIENIFFKVFFIAILCPKMSGVMRSFLYSYLFWAIFNIYYQRDPWNKGNIYEVPEEDWLLL